VAKVGHEMRLDGWWCFVAHGAACQFDELTTGGCKRHRFARIAWSSVEMGLPTFVTSQSADKK
jgi:hypothetical protein